MEAVKFSPFTLTFLAWIVFLGARWGVASGWTVGLPPAAGQVVHWTGWGVPAALAFAAGFALVHAVRDAAQSVIWGGVYAGINLVVVNLFWTHVLSLHFAG